MRPGTDEGLDTAKGIPADFQRASGSPGEEPEESGVDLVALRAGLQELEEEIGKVSS